MSQHNDNARPAANGTGDKQADRPGQIVTDFRAAERSRRSRRWARRELDQLVGTPVPNPGTVDYAAMGFTLGYEQRRASGLALLEAERAA